ncbi:uncharacterized protein LOC132555578 [Ylistrum balloti]|uniref:uncharacterized protein LOC132555578 n=1 Tax=Ylistrum balloti TaxID=509963 RepID=UPI002905AD14|nr:uncharacterized protein LOC132555578 [Ylistrum balloti]
MTSRYINALDYADINAKRILKKHAKKRPLGELESRLRYTPAQPVLSCRTVDIDVSGTRTYRSRSTTDIITEQHKLIHNLYTRTSRNITSAPNRRNGVSTRTDDEFARRQRINIEVHGRPLTSQSQSSLQHTNRAHSSTRRPKTTGNLKKVSFLSHDLSINQNTNAEYLETSREHKKLTDKIHEHWDPGNHDLNTGTFVRGQQKPDAPPSLEAGWLTFGGVNSEEASGVIDAFAQLRDDEEYYNIEGKVGSRVAQQLQKGDKIRVGINGRIQSDDLKVKRQDSCLSRQSSEFEKADKENMEKTVIPLCWDDELTTSKVISPREQKDDGPKPVMSETHPVIYTHEKNEVRRPNLTKKSTKQSPPKPPEGFKIKHRKKSRQSLDGQADEKIMVITIDQKSSLEETKLQGLSVDDVLQNKLNGNKAPTDSVSDMDISTIQDSPRTGGRTPSEDTSRNTAKSNISDSALSVEPLRITTPKSKPVSPPYVSKNVPSDLIVGPSSGNLAGRVKSASSTSRSSRGGSERGSAKYHNRPTPPKPLHTFNTPSSFNVYGTRGETEFIQITSQIRNPNPPPPAPHSSPLKESYLAQSYSDEAIRQVVQQNIPVTEENHQQAPASSPDIPDICPSKQEEEMEPPPPTPQPDLRTTSPGSTGLAISIPTAEEFSDRDFDSTVNSPWTSQRENVIGMENDPRGTSKREAAYRDSQIDQITSLLKGAIVVPTDKNSSFVVEKSVKFQEGS